MQDDWPTYQLAYTENGRKKTMELPFTFADFAATEIRFRKHFRVAPPETWNDKMLPVDEYLELSEEERASHVPFVWSVNRQQQLTRLLVAPPIIHSCEDRRDFWKMLKAIARVGRNGARSIRNRGGSASRNDGSDRHRYHAVDHGRFECSGSAWLPGTLDETRPRMAAIRLPLVGTGAAHHRPITWHPGSIRRNAPPATNVSSLNPAIFQYNEQKKAIIKNPQGGPVQGPRQSRGTLYRTDHSSWSSQRSK